MVPRRSSFLLPALGLSLALAAPVRAAESWIVARTRHFELYSDDSEAESRRILAGLEEFRANLLHLLPLGRASEPRTTVVVFSRDSAFRPYKPLYKGKPKPLSGYFIANDDEVMIAMTTDTPSQDLDSRRVIYHEYVHLLLNARDARLPLWLNEGLAEVLSTFGIKNGKVQLGEPIDDHVALLQHVPLLSLARLFAVTPEFPEYNEESRMGIFYAESWALTHYLLFGKDKSNGDKLGRFLQDLRRGGDMKAAFGDAFGVSFATLQFQLEEYLRGGGYYRRAAPTVAQNVTIAFRPASDVERDAALLDLRWRVQHNADAGYAAFGLLKRDPGNARAHELLAAIALDSGDGEAAQGQCRQAAEHGSDNAWVYLQLLKSVLSAYHGATLLDARLSDEVVAPWRAWAARAWQLSPDSRDAIESVLMVEALAEKMDVRRINAAQAQLGTLQDQARGLLALAIVHWRANQIPSTRTLLNMVDSQPRAEMATRAAADALRYRLPQEPQPAAPATLTFDENNAAVALRAGRESEAAVFLDRLLMERGTTAPLVKLAPLTVRAPASAAADPWRRADELRERADAGDADAMFELAVAHACAAGVEFSPTLAREWLTKAAEHGNVAAKIGLPPPEADPAETVQFLREQKLPWAGGNVPPLERDLASRIAREAGASDRHPPELVYGATPRFPDSVLKSGGKGEAVVRCRLRPDGHVEAAHATTFTDRACAAAAEQGVADCRYLPAIRDGHPVATLAEVVVTFEAVRTRTAGGPAGG